MSKNTYRRRAVLSRVHKALDAFYLLQRIDWEYDARETLERMIALALEEVEFEGGKAVERALVILRTEKGSKLEVKAGWKTEELDLSFSRTVVERTIEEGEPILCENAKDDPRFMQAESIKGLEILSLISVPLKIDDQAIGAFYIESKSPGNIFDADDLEFLCEFAATIAPYIKAALTHHEHVGEIRKLREEVTERYSLGNIIGRSRAIQNVFELVRIAADLDRTVLITGESGCGKELVAKAIHYNGHRRSGNFVVVDCSGLAEHLLESELFGHCKGAFTGASHDKVGAFEEAHNGTLFLDEISDASKALQQKLRRVLQEGEIRRVGENRVRRVDVRVICATNRNLAEMVRRGEFMRDLYYRINKFPIHIPPLRERREDIPLLVEHFLERHARGGGETPRITAEAMEHLVSRDWRENNIRELRNTVELAADLARGGAIDLAVLEKVDRIQRGEGPYPTSEAVPASDFMETVRVDPRGFDRYLEGEGARGAESRRSRLYYRLEKEFAGKVTLEALRRSRWKLRPAARLLGLSPTKFRSGLRDYLAEALERRGGDLSAAASDLDMPESVLERKIKDLGLVPERSARQESA